VPNITMLVFRDPDNYTETRMFVDGVESTNYSETTFDPGAGQSLSSVRGRAYEALNEPGVTEDLKVALQQGFEMMTESGYTEDDSAKCIYCDEYVTEYATWINGQHVLNGYMDSGFSLAGEDGHQHTSEVPEREDDDTDKEQDL
jgi:hypothetical protein